jgi:hypothetical protein
MINKQQIQNTKLSVRTLTIPCRELNRFPSVLLRGSLLEVINYSNYLWLLFKFFCSPGS